MNDSLTEAAGDGIPKLDMPAMPPLNDEPDFCTITRRVADPPARMPQMHRCRWCGSHNGNWRTPAHIAGPCRGRIKGQCEKWEEGMLRWPSFLNPGEYVDEKDGQVKLRAEWVRENQVQIMCDEIVKLDRKSQNYHDTIINFITKLGFDPDDVKKECAENPSTAMSTVLMSLVSRRDKQREEAQSG